LERRYEVVAVADGQAALERIRADLPDLVLADVMMPRLDGFGLVAAIRADERTRTLPAILLSARAGEESRIEGLAAGADDYLIKPFSARELLARIGSQLELARLRRETDRRKDEFLATLAHELRTPLAPIRNSVHILRMGRQVHPGGRPDLAHRPARRVERRGVCPRQRHGDPNRGAPQGVRPVHAGGTHLQPRPGRSGDRADSGAQPGEPARRERRGQERRPRPGKRIRRALAPGGGAARGE